MEVYPNQIKIYAAGTLTTMNPLDGSVSSGAGNMSQEGSVIPKRLCLVLQVPLKKERLTPKHYRNRGGFEQTIDQVQFPDQSTVDLHESWKRLSDGKTFDGL